MQAMMDAIKSRRSIRRYLGKPIPEEVLAELLEAIRWAPSWHNTQCTEVVVVKDPEVKAKLQGTLGRNPAFKAMVGAPAVLVLCARLEQAGFVKGESTTRYGDWFMYDVALANQNLCLAAHAAGLGTVIVGSFDHAKVERILGVPAGFKVVTMVPVGYPERVGKTPPRQKLDEFVHQDRFGA